MEGGLPHLPTGNPSISDSLGQNIPPNERVMRGSDWEPAFDPLGQPAAPEPPAPPEPAVVPPPAPAPAAPVSIPDPAPYYHPTYHRRRSRHLHTGKSGWSSMGWLVPVIFIAAFASGTWWLIFLAWPVMGLIKRSARTGDWTPAGLIMIGLGAVAMMSMMGASMAMMLPVLLIVGGLVFLFRSFRVTVT